MCINVEYKHGTVHTYAGDEKKEASQLSPTAVSERTSPLSRHAGNAQSTAKKVKHTHRRQQMLTHRLIGFPCSCRVLTPTARQDSDSAAGRELLEGVQEQVRLMVEVMEAYQVCLVFVVRLKAPDDSVLFWCL